MKKYGLVLLVVVSIFVVGCSKKTVGPSTCQNDSECTVDRDGKTFAGVCYFGKCQECVNTTDCPAAHVCMEQKCEPRCESDIECGQEKYCGSSGACLAKCKDDTSCSDGEACLSGKCVAGFAACESNTDCASGFSCDSGLCSKEGVYQLALDNTCDPTARVYFDFNRFNLREDDMSTAEKVAVCLKKNPLATLRIDGHTDSRGSVAYNVSLGENRARTLKNYLVRSGISEDRVTINSFGEAMPLNRENTPEAHAQNRRDEITLEQ